ncbi:MAG: histone deacetylase [Deltaproteobacteria bacterium]|nr:histone deacetylase [Deltaproteobacteria bacterium]
MSRFRPIALVTDPRYLDHDTANSLHPEIPARLEGLLKRLESSPLAPYLKKISPRKAEMNRVLAVHDEDYLSSFEGTCISGREFFGHPDNRLGYHSYEIALLAAGGCLSGIDIIENGESELVFCCIRPPGHHAERAQALGFCFLNNIAIAARYWKDVYSKERILIIDWDAHHGNGIQEIFDQDPDVFYISIHEHPTFSFPGTGYANETGTGPGEGATLNIPLPPGSGDEAILNALKGPAGEAVKKFRPEAIIVAAGFDAHVMDDMSGLAYTTKLYGYLGTFMAFWAERYCQGKVLSILEGGYHPEALPASVEAYLAGLSVCID